MTDSGLPISSVDDGDLLVDAMSSALISAIAPLRSEGAREMPLSESSCVCPSPAPQPFTKR